MAARAPVGVVRPVAPTQRIPPVRGVLAWRLTRRKITMTDDRMERLVKAVREHSNMDDDQIRDAGTHGADAGWPGFTYTGDAAEFTRKNAELVYDILGDDAEEMGYDNIPAFVATFARADMAESRDGYDNLLAWYALEAAGRYLEDRGEDA